MGGWEQEGTGFRSFPWLVHGCRITVRTCRVQNGTESKIMFVGINSIFSDFWLGAESSFHIEYIYIFWDLFLRLLLVMVGSTKLRKPKHCLCKQRISQGCTQGHMCTGTSEKMTRVLRELLIKCNGSLEDYYFQLQGISKCDF